MRIILLEATHANKTTKGARNFISVQHAKVSIAEWQISVAVDAMFKHVDTDGSGRIDARVDGLCPARDPA